MPTPVLHAGCMLSCQLCHGPINVTPADRKLKIGVQNVRVLEDTYTVVPAPGVCPGTRVPTPEPPGPCNAVRFSGASVSAKLRVGTFQVLLQDAAGMNVGWAAPGVPNAPLTPRRAGVTITASPAKLEASAAPSHGV